MKLSCLAALVAAAALQVVSAGPLAKRQGSESDSSSSTTPTAALIASTLSDGSTTTVEIAAPTAPGSSTSTSSGTAQRASTTAAASSTTTTSAAPSGTGVPPTLTDEFPICGKEGKPFCNPANESTLHVGGTYYITWNPKFFPSNSTVTVKLQYMDNENILQEAWSSKEAENRWGMATVKMEKDWLQGYTLYNLTFFAVNFEPNKLTEQAKPYKGPTITLRNKPPQHLKAQQSGNPDKMGLMIGLPVSLGFIAIVVFGLWFGMRKRRSIGIGNIMGRNRGYGDRKSRRQRMGVSKEGAIRLETQPSVSSRTEYRDQSHAPHAHARGDSLGSLVSDDGIRPAPRDNQFRDEIQRQKTGR